MLNVRDLTITFPSNAGPLAAVEGLSFTIERNETFAIIGESGSGKSLTAMSVVGLTPPGAQVTGEITLNGDPLSGLSDRALARVRGRRIGIVYQDPISALNPVHRIGDQIAEGLIVHGLARRSEAARQAVSLLDKMRIPDPGRVALAYPHQISGGMRQRAVFAMALACGPDLLIADEPTTALDVTIKAQVLDLLRTLRSEMDLTTLLITHDMGVVAEAADRILVMYAGQIAELGPAEAILSAPSHPYSQALLQSALIGEAAPQTILPAVAGAPPGLTEVVTGCRFNPRCPFATDLCRKEVPAPRSVGPVTVACHHPIKQKAEAAT